MQSVLPATRLLREISLLKQKNRTSRKVNSNFTRLFDNERVIKEFRENGGKVKGWALHPFDDHRSQNWSTSHYSTDVCSLRQPNLSDNFQRWCGKTS